MNHRRIALHLSAGLLAATTVAAPLAAPASADHATLFALEIFDPEPGGVPDPLCASTSRGVQPAASADLPAGTVPVAVIQGSLTRRPASVNRCRFDVSIGSGTFTVYNSAETRISARQLLRRGVRVVTARDEETGVLVAERVVGRSTARNEIERAFLATVTVTQQGLTEWTATETGTTPRSFTFDVQQATVEVVGAADVVAIEFDTVAPVPD
jgi:hypothetical protein